MKTPQTLSDVSILAWIQENNIKTEAGTPLDMRNHMFMFDIYRDLTPIQCVMKAAQITASTCFSLKVPWVVKNIGLDAIYTLPTETDRNAFVGGKVNRMIAQNPIMQTWVKDKDSVEQKQVGDNLIHFRGTFTQKAAIMVPSDLNVYDEIDASKQSVIEQYATRLQHSKYQWEWYLSHPSAEGTGVHKIWEKSDQKHWFVTPACGHKQYLRWPESIDPVRKVYQCTTPNCHQEITDDDRRRGTWVKRYANRTISGYWVPLLICPWVSAEKVLGYFEDKSEEYFYNKVLGLPYVGRGNKLTLSHLMANLTDEILVPAVGERDIMGVDTGLKLDYVMGGYKGLYYHGEAKDYNELDRHMKENPKMVAIVDGGGDLIGSRQFRDRWPGRVFLGFFGGEKRATDEPVWNDAEHMVAIDRNKIIQTVVDEFIDKRIPLQGTEEDWYDYWLDWNNLTRVKVIDATTQEAKGSKWIRNGRDHRALATTLWRVGMMRFGKGFGKLLTPHQASTQQGREILGDTVSFRPQFVYPSPDEESYDWRTT